MRGGSDPPEVNMSWRFQCSANDLSLASRNSPVSTFSSSDGLSWRDLRNSQSDQGSFLRIWWAGYIRLWCIPFWINAQMSSDPHLMQLEQNKKTLSFLLIGRYMRNKWKYWSKSFTMRVTWLRRMCVPPACCITACIMPLKMVSNLTNLSCNLQVHRRTLDDDKSVCENLCIDIDRNNFPIDIILQTWLNHSLLVATQCTQFCSHVHWTHPSERWLFSG